MALVKGTNCGFVETAPEADPGATGMDFYNSGFAVKDTAPAGATVITEIGWWSDVVNEEANYEVGIYEHNIGDDNPEAVVAIDATNAKGTTAGWKRSTGLNIPITPETIYWLAIQCDPSATHSKIDWAAEVGERSDRKSGLTELIDPWGDSTEQYAYLTAIYAVYATAEPSAKPNFGCIAVDQLSHQGIPGIYP
jgi:hypothetical protein